MTSAYGTSAAFLTTLGTLPRNAGVAAVDTNGAGLAPFQCGFPCGRTGYRIPARLHRQHRPLAAHQLSRLDGGIQCLHADQSGQGRRNQHRVGNLDFGWYQLPAPGIHQCRALGGRASGGGHAKLRQDQPRADVQRPRPSGLVNNSEVFGGDGSPESTTASTGNRDSAWVYHVPSVASNVSTLYILKEVVCVYDATGYLRA